VTGQAIPLALAANNGYKSANPVVPNGPRDPVEKPNNPASPIKPAKPDDQQF
jgi:hypothetical protein